MDSKNPRLPDKYQNASQPELLSLLAEDYNLPDIGHSIAENGYFSEEPLVTIKHPKLPKWIVVEGNRRLAALKILAAPAKAPPDLRETWADIAAHAERRVTEVPTLVYAKRSEITPYLGFRHITGVLQWGPYQKGRYIADLVEEAKLSFNEIARLIGSKARTVREHYVAFTLVRQARDAFNIDTDLAQDYFGILRRSISDPGIRAFITLNLDRTEQQLAKPVPRTKASELQELFGWMFGTKTSAPAMRESRDIAKLGAALASETSLAALRTTNDLTYAFELSGGEQKRLIEALSRASYQLDIALPMALRHKRSREVLNLAEKCLEVMTELARLLNLKGTLL